MLADLHEFQITPWNTALITTEHPVVWNTSSIHGPKRQIVLDAVVQEIDIPTGLVLFQWDSLDHVPVSYTHQPLPVSSDLLFDYFHVNSIDVDLDNNLVDLKPQHMGELQARSPDRAHHLDPRGQALELPDGPRCFVRVPA